MTPPALSSTGLTVRQHHAACITLIGVSIVHAVKTAKLKLGMDGKDYGRRARLGVLTAGTEAGVTTLTCIFDNET